MLAWGGDLKSTTNITKNKKNITVIDDYGHHPTEIEAVIKATKKAYPNKEINLVFQPIDTLELKIVLMN